MPLRTFPSITLTEINRRQDLHRRRGVLQAGQQGRQWRTGCQGTCIGLWLIVEVREKTRFHEDRLWDQVCLPRGPGGRWRLGHCSQYQDQSVSDLYRALPPGLSYRVQEWQARKDFLWFQGVAAYWGLASKFGDGDQFAEKTPRGEFRLLYQDHCGQWYQDLKTELPSAGCAWSEAE